MDTERDKRRVLALTEEVARLQGVIHDLQNHNTQTAQKHETEKQYQAAAMMEKGNQIVSLLQENQKLQEMYAAAQAKSKAATNQLETLQLTLRRQEDTSTQQQMQFNELNARYEEVCSLVSDLNSDLERERAESEALRSAFYATKQREMELIAQLEDTTGASTGVAARAREAIASVDALRAQNEALAHTLTDRENQLSTTAAELAALREAHDSTVQRLQTQLLELTRRVHLTEMTAEANKSVHESSVRFAGIGKDMTFTARSPMHPSYTATTTQVHSPQALALSQLSPHRESKRGGTNTFGAEKALEEAISRAATAELEMAQTRNELQKEAEHKTLITKQLEELQQTAAQLAEQNAALVDELQRYQNELTTATANSQDNRNRGLELQEQVLELQRKCTQAEADNLAMAHKMRLLQADLEHQRVLAKTNGETAEAAVRQAEELSNILADKEHALQQISLKRDENQGVVRTLQAEKEMLQQQLSQLNQQYQETNNDLLRVQKELLRQQKLVAELQQQLSQAKLLTSAASVRTVTNDRSPLQHAAASMSRASSRMRNEPSTNSGDYEVDVKTGPTKHASFSVVEPAPAEAQGSQEVNQSMNDELADMKFRLMRSETEKRLLKMEMQKTAEAKTPNKTPTRAMTSVGLQRSRSADRLGRSRSFSGGSGAGSQTGGVQHASFAMPVRASPGRYTEQSSATPLQPRLSHISEKAEDVSDNDTGSYVTDAVVLDHITSKMDVLRTGPSFINAYDYTSLDTTPPAVASSSASAMRVPSISMIRTGSVGNGSQLQTARSTYLRNDEPVNAIPAPANDSSSSHLSTGLSNQANPAVVMRSQSYDVGKFRTAAPNVATRPYQSFATMPVNTQAPTAAGTLFSPDSLSSARALSFVPAVSAGEQPAILSTQPAAADVAPARTAHEFTSGSVLHHSMSTQDVIAKLQKQLDDTKSRLRAVASVPVLQH